MLFLEEAGHRSECGEPTSRKIQEQRPVATVGNAVVDDGTAHLVALLQAVDAPRMRAQVPGAQCPPFRGLVHRHPPRNHRHLHKAKRPPELDGRVTIRASWRNYRALVRALTSGGAVFRATDRQRLVDSTSLLGITKAGKA